MIAIRQLEAADIEALRAIDEQAHGQAWSYAAFADQISSPLFHHLVAIDGSGAPVAHAATWLEGDTVRVTNVACDPAATGRGHATRLLVQLFRGLPPSERVSLEVRPANRRAQRLYSRFGFRPVGVTRSFYDRADASGSRDALVMQVSDPHGPQWQQRLAAVAEHTAVASSQGSTP